ncbi:MAG: hypothetical protein JRF33_12675 [Deltaproteobacteria bacterium]|nr:hypothetical protein [Deltaproteobacteria bacterium]
MRQGKWRWAHVIGVLFSLTAITLAHHLTDPEAVVSHNVFRRLYYLPVVWGVVVFGWRGGLSAAALATASYVPHAFFMHHHLDPAPFIDKAMEIALFFAVGGLGGLLMDRERASRARATERRLAQLAAETRANRLDALVHLSRGLAHEIRNPLGGIQGAIEIISDEVAKDSPRQDMVEVALGETARLSKVLDDFLRFARPGRPEIQNFHSAETSQHLGKLLKGEASSLGLELQIEDPGTWIFADPDQINQVLINLLRNAMQSCPRGGRVALRIAPKNEHVEFIVADQGAGIPEEIKQAIYDPYFTTREEGTGLGLPISAMLIAQNKGQLNHRPARPSPGTEFFFSLPAGRPKGGQSS